jgi:transposase InsO family protein
VQLSRYVVDAVVLEGRSVREVALAHGISKSWVGELVRRFRKGGYQAIEPGSRAPHRRPHRVSSSLEDEIVTLRKTLSDDGLDAGAQTIHYHLSLIHETVPAVSTIWRVLKRRGFVVSQPHKRPRSSWTRFEASLPNECWQSDVTHWRLKDDSAVEIINFIDDHSRLCLASRVVAVATAPAVVGVFRQAAETWGFPASVLTDNGCVYTAWHRGGTNVMEAELLSRGIAFKHSRPYHPQTCGKVERFHQTLKSFLAKQPAVLSIAQLQAQIDRFVAYYNNTRPHRARGRITPRAAFDARDKARPLKPGIDVGAGVRVRHDKVHRDGKVTLRHRGRLHHIGIGKPHRGKRVIMLVAGLDIRVLTDDGELLRRLTLDPTRDYQPSGNGDFATMPRDIQPA